MGRFQMAVVAAIVVAVVLFGATLLRLDEPWVLGAVAVATFIMTYWAVNQEHHRKPWA